MEKELKVPVAILDACCELCAHSCPRKPVETFLERWEADTRPERPKGFIAFLRGLWRKDKTEYRREYPYFDGFCGARVHDHMEMERRENIICTLFPKHRAVSKKHYCGQFKPKAVIGDERI